MESKRYDVWAYWQCGMCKRNVIADIKDVAQLNGSALAVTVELEETGCGWCEEGNMRLKFAVNRLLEEGE